MNRDPLEIRKARTSDIEALTLLLEALFSIEADFDFDVQRQTKGLSMLLGDTLNPSCVLVAEIDGRIVSMVTIQTWISTAEGGWAGMVEDLVVSKDYRGRGIGAGLFRSAEGWAHKKGIRRLQLLADKQNSPALAFYDTQKWQKIGLITLRKMLP